VHAWQKGLEHGNGNTALFSSDGKSGTNGQQAGLSAAAAKNKSRNIQDIKPELPQTVLRRAGSGTVARVSGNGSGREQSD